MSEDHRKISKECALNSIQSQYKDTSIILGGDKTYEINRVSYHK